MGVELNILSSAATAGGTTPPPGLADAILAQNGGSGQRNIAGIAESLSRLTAQDPQQGAAARSQIEARLSPVERGQLAASLPVHATLPNGKGIDFGPNGLDADSWINLVRSTPQFQDTYKGLVQVAGGNDSNAALKDALGKLHDSGMSVQQYLAANSQPATASAGVGASASASVSTEGGGWKASVAHFLDGTSLAGRLEDAAQPYLAKAGHAVGLDQVPGVGAWAQKALDTPGTFQQFREGAIEGVLDGGESLVTGTASLTGKTAQYAEDISPAGYAGDILRGQIGKSMPGALDAVLPSASRGDQTSKAIGDTALAVGKYAVSRAGRDDLVAQDVIGLGGKLIDRAGTAFTQAGQQGGVGAQVRLLGKAEGRTGFEIGSLFVGGAGVVSKVGTAAKTTEAISDVAKGGEAIATVNDAAKAGQVVTGGTEAANALGKTAGTTAAEQALAREVTSSSGKYVATEAADGRRVFKNTLDVTGGKPAFVDASVNKSIRAKVEAGWTNKELMERGYAPIGPDGKQINLHHILGQESGPMVELTASTHQKFYKPLHGLIEDGTSFRNDPALAKQYRDFRGDWWKARANDF